MPVYALVLWALVGLLAGQFAPKLLGPRRPFGTGGDMVVGAIGAIAGGYGLGLIGGSGGTGIVVSLLTGLIGAVVLLWGARKLKA